MQSGSRSETTKRIEGFLKEAGIKKWHVDDDEESGIMTILVHKDYDNQFMVRIDRKGDMQGFSTINGKDTTMKDMGIAEEEIMRFAHDVGTGEGRWRDQTRFRYLSLTDMAKRLGIDTTVMANYRLPFPDVYIGERRGWTEETFGKWRERHPRVGRNAKPVKAKRRGKGRRKRERKYEW